MVYKKMMKMKFTSDNVEPKEVALDDDSGYELDDSGMIPKLEELKAAGKSGSDEEKNSILLEKEKTFSEGETEVFSTEKKINVNDEVIYSIDNFLDEKTELNPLEKDFSRSIIVEKESLSDSEAFDYMEDDDVDDEDLSEDLDEFFNDGEEIYEDENTFDKIEDYYNENVSAEEEKFFDEEDISDVKVKFYDEAKEEKFFSDIDALSDREKIMEAIGDAFVDAERLLDTLDRIADSLDRIADSLEMMEK